MTRAKRFEGGAFSLERGRFAMAREHPGVVRQREDFGGKAIKNLAEIGG